MTAEQNKALVRRLVHEAVNPGNLDVLDEIAQSEFAAAARPGPDPSAIPFLTSGWRSPNWSPMARKWLRISGAPGPTWGMDGPPAGRPALRRCR